jgi:glycerol-3-phosphate dehydrogenase (NAD(P)+)
MARGLPSHGNQATASRAWGYSRGWRLFTVIILRPLLRLLMRYEWQGKENFPRTGGVILAPNHLSYADWPTIALFSDSYGHRYPVFMIKSAVVEVKLIGPLLYKVGQLPVFPGRGDAGPVLKQAEQALAAGACVIVYPEGTATRDPDLWPMVGKTGAARLALTTGAPVVPIARWGAQDVLPYGSKKPKLWPRRTVRMAANLAAELVRRQITGTVVACISDEGAPALQSACHAPYFRPYTNADVIGCELGEAVKNIIAIVVGVAVAMGLGDNTRALLITRGLAEMARLGSALGAQVQTFAGLAGMGDLVAACSSPLSRNRTFGENLGRGVSVAEAAALGQTAEGVASCEPVLELAESHGVEMPITEVAAAVMRDGLPVEQAASMLASRSARPEWYGP